MILNDVYEVKAEWSSIMSRVAPDEDPPIEIRVFIERFCDAEPPAPDNLSERLLCKMPNQERIATLLELTPSSEPGTCKSRNEDAFAWALEQLTPAEREAYEAEGWPVTFLEDEVVNMGGAWLGLPANFELAEDGQSYEIGSPSLQTEFDPNDPDPETPDGVHYCKLVTPAQALYWVLHRGFKDDPGICEEVSESGCPIPNATPTGSCIFLHHPTPTMPEQHFCEEYTGPSWTEADAEAKCAEREDGFYKSVSCAERPDETSEIDGDGEYKGACVIACGDLEYIWLVYSGTAEEIAPYCPEGFFLPNGEKVE
jgi:hypothetical protein